jgi:hypothetical protein
MLVTERCGVQLDKDICIGAFGHKESEMQNVKCKMQNEEGKRHQALGIRKRNCGLLKD